MTGQQIKFSFRTGKHSFVYQTRFDTFRRRVKRLMEHIGFDMSYSISSNENAVDISIDIAEQKSFSINVPFEGADPGNFSLDLAEMTQVEKIALVAFALFIKASFPNKIDLGFVDVDRALIKSAERYLISIQAVAQRNAIAYEIDLASENLEKITISAFERIQSFENQLGYSW